MTNIDAQMLSLVSGGQAGAKVVTAAVNAAFPDAVWSKHSPLTFSPQGRHFSGVFTVPVTVGNVPGRVWHLIEGWMSKGQISRTTLHGGLPSD
jgi:hypothetical protein